MERRSKILYHVDVLKTIRQWSEEAKGTMQKIGSPLNNIKAELSPHKKAFKVEFENTYRSGKRLDVGQKHKKILFKTSDTELVF